MDRGPLPPVAAVIGFIDCVNRGDVDGLGKLMSEDHEVVVFGEEALRGRARNIRGWAGYLDGCPEYVIYPSIVAEPCEGCVAVLGHTTGSHLGLADHEERALSVIWFAEVTDASCAAGDCWKIHPSAAPSLGSARLRRPVPAGQIAPGSSAAVLAAGPRRTKEWRGWRAEIARSE